MTQDSAPVVAARVLLEHGLADDVVVSYVAADVGARRTALRCHRRCGAVPARAGDGRPAADGTLSPALEGADE